MCHSPVIGQLHVAEAVVATAGIVVKLAGTSQTNVPNYIWVEGKNVLS